MTTETAKIYKLLKENTLKVSNNTYSFRIKKNIREYAYLGMTKSDKQRIYIMTGLNLEVLKDTLLHEVLHAIYHAQSLNQVSNLQDTEEYLVSVFATNIMQVIQDNPWFGEVLCL